MYTDDYPSDLPGSYDGCGEEKVCDCLGNSLKVIAEATSSIAVTLKERLGNKCDFVDECIDKIIEKIKYRLEGPLYSCEECRRMVENGTAGTLEFAIRCAGNALTDCKKSLDCSMSNPDSWGKPCTGCGKEPCCCDKGVCKPCPTDPPEKIEYWGWCQDGTGIVAVTRKGATAPGPNFRAVAFAETEAAALEQAEQVCGRYVPNDGEPQPIQISPLSIESCSLAGYANGQIAGQIASNRAGIDIVAGTVQTDAALGRFGFDGLNVNNIGEVLVGMARLHFGGPAYHAKFSFEHVGKALGCQNSSFMNGLYLLNALDLIGKNTGADYSEWTQSIRYAMNHACRQRQLTPEMGMAAYLANSINRQQLDTIWGIHGICPDALNAYEIAARSKPIPLQLASMRRRQLISQSEYNVRMRQLGYVEQQVSDNLFKLTEQLPGLSDITRMMVRDAADDGLAQQFGLDAEFSKKYTGKLREYAEFQGIPHEVAKLNWRAHWTIPSPGQLFHFYHRLRNNPKFGGAGKLLGDVKTALIQQDILPFWHDHYLETSFLPMTRVDVRRAFNIGSITEQDVRQSYVDLGYSDTNADRLTKFTVKLRDASVLGHKAIKLWIKFAIDRNEAFQRMTGDGLPANIVNKALDDTEVAFQSSEYAAAYVRGDISKQDFINALAPHGVTNQGATKIADRLSYRITSHKALKSYIVGTIDNQQARTDMLGDGLPTAVVNKLLAEADTAVEATFVVNCQRGVKRRYMLGEFDKQQAHAELVKRGTVAARATKLVDWWDCERSSGNKAVAAAKLCEWLARGAINGPEFTRRLEKIGYSAADAALMLDDCLIGVSLKRQAQAKKESKEQQAEQSRIEAAQRRQQADAQRLANQAAAASKKAAQARANREKQLYSAAAKVYAKCKCELEAAVGAVLAVKQVLMQQYGMGVDEALQTTIKAAETYKGESLAEYAELAKALAEGAELVETA